jgi:methionine sulfoxide reductase catalytic subunit
MPNAPRDPSPRISASEVTPEYVFLSRRSLIRAGLVVASSAATYGLYRALNAPGSASVDASKFAALPTVAAGPSTRPVYAYPLPDEPKTPFESVAGYNNFYEFTTNKEGVAAMAKDFTGRPWTVEVGGMCHKPRTFDLDDILRLAPPEERIYRFRCVEAWSMVIPWNGFPLSVLLDAVEPMSGTKFVAFETLNDPTRFPGQRRAVLPWPYVEGLRMDEAMHPLTLLASGVYGRALPGQNGAPLRLVVPWKYGFKNIKSIVRITLTDHEPPCTWNKQAPQEYGFYANVNPQVDHPRWSQATEERIGNGGGRKPTLLFNGYAEQVGSLYSNLDLRTNF